MAKTWPEVSNEVLTNSEIKRMADEAEGGFDVELLKQRRRGRPSLGSGPAEVVPVRLDPDPGKRSRLGPRRRA